MVTVVFEIDLPEFATLFERLPDVDVRLVDVRCIDRPHGLFWTTGGDTRAITECLENDSEIADVDLLKESQGSRLFRIEFSTSSILVELYRELVALDGTVFDAARQDGTWEMKLFFPNREAISTFYDRCKDMGIDPALRSLTRDVGAPAIESFGLTDAQRETLVEAASRGYFSVPKEISLVELADELGVSDQATSERLRRGSFKLISNTLLTENQSDSASIGR